MSNDFFCFCFLLGNSVVLTEDTDKFIIGNRIWVGGTKPGHIAYIGETNFGTGDWAGIVLDEPIGNWKKKCFLMYFLDGFTVRFNY